MATCLKQCCQLAMPPRPRPCQLWTLPRHLPACRPPAQGMLLPFGALNAHHNMPNTFLFHPQLGYTLGAGSDPLQASGRLGGMRPGSLQAAAAGHPWEAQVGDQWALAAAVPGHHTGSRFSASACRAGRWRM